MYFVCTYAQDWYLVKNFWRNVDHLQCSNGQINGFSSTDKHRWNLFPTRYFISYGIIYATKVSTNLFFAWKLVQLFISIILQYSLSNLLFFRHLGQTVYFLWQNCELTYQLRKNWDILSGGKIAHPPIYKPKVVLVKKQAEFKAEQGFLVIK